MLSPAATAADELMARLNPVWSNTYWIKNALELCEGMWQHAAELPKQHHHFFSLVQKFALDSAVLGICKLFDRSNPSYPKDTIPDVMDYAKTNFIDTYASRLDTQTLIDLGVSDHDATKIIMDFRKGSDFLQTRDNLFMTLGQLIPTRENNSSLQKLFFVRDKVIAHQERVNSSKSEQLEYLPSLDDMENINNWGSNFCRLVACIMTNTTLLPHAVSARMAALSVVEKVLGKNFDPSKGGAAYQEWEAFYKKP